MSQEISSDKFSDVVLRSRIDPYPALEALNNPLSFVIWRRRHMALREVSQLMLPVVVMTLLVQVGASGWVADMEDEVEMSSRIFNRLFTFESSPSEFEFAGMNDYHFIVAGNLRHFTRPGEPMLPMKTSTLEFDKNAEILDVRLFHERRLPIAGRFNIAPTPEPLFWGVDTVGEWTKDPEVYALDTHFPGDSFSYRIEEDNHRKYVHIQHYPVQYKPSDGEIAIVTELSLQITYRYFPTNEPLADDLTAECIIITATSLYPEAKQLADFHEGTLGVPTSVVNTSWIDANYAEASDPPYPGYWDSGLNGWGQIIGYDYSLAKKTVNFLSDAGAHPNLEYVLLYGNAELVPPSFYWFDSFIGPMIPYEGWIPTDFFYGSPDYDFTPNYAIGRLPVDGDVRAQALNQKVENWHANLSPTWFNEYVAAGGRPFGSGFYVGELINQDTLNRGYLDGFGITKLYQTDGTFDKAHMLDVLSGEYGIVNAIGHGQGDGFIVNDSTPPGEVVEVADVMALPANTNVSVFASIGCGNGAFDSTVMANKPYMSAISFAEAVLFSQAGAIAYIGGARMNQGVPTGYIDDGELFITAETHMAHLLTSYWKAFRNGAGTLGNMSSGAMLDFSSTENMADIQNVRAILEYVLLADPVLPMTHPQQNRHSVPTTEIMDVVGSEDYGDPFLASGPTPLVGLNRPNKARVETDSPSVDFKIIDTEADLTLEYGSNTTSLGVTYYDFTPTRSAVLLLRAEGEDGKEGWQYMKSLFVPAFPKAPVLMTALLGGAGDQDFVLNWYKSIDEGLPEGTTKYEIFRSDTISGLYNKVDETPATGQEIYEFIDPGRGDGDTNNYFYYVQSVNSSGQKARSYYAGKYAKFLSEGWHLISLPLVQDDWTTDVIFRTLDVESVATYVTGDTNDPWKRHEFSKSWGDLEVIDRRMGLWVKTTSDDYLTIAGLVPKSTEIWLKPGWNLVSYPTFTGKTVFEELGFIQFDRIEGFDINSQPYCLRLMNPFDLMSTGTAYWIEMGSSYNWTVTNPS